MKALSLWQPWASLVAAGGKQMETRSWPAPAALVGERLAIHASKTGKHLRLVQQEPFKLYLPEELPLGAILATVRLESCELITLELRLRLREESPHEFAFGDYTPGRFVWRLKELQPLSQPLPFTGRQKFFTVPDSLLSPFLPLPAGAST